MRNIYLIVLIIFMTQRIFAFEPDMLNLQVPSRLEKTEFVFAIQHRFYGEITEDPLNTFFGLDAGANVGLGVRYAVLPHVEVHASYTRFQKEYVVGARYAYHVSQIFTTMQIDIHYFDHESHISDERARNFFYCLALQSEPSANIIIPVVNIGYDGYNERFGLGFGMGFGFDLEIGPIERVHIIGEYYPVISRDEEINGPENYFAAGLKFETYGHHFILLIGNGSQIGTRRLMLGAESNDDFYFGFNIHRILDL